MNVLAHALRRSIRRAWPRSASDLDGLQLDSSGLRALRGAGVKIVLPLIAEGELIGILNLGPRLSNQDYSGDDRRLLEHVATPDARTLRLRARDEVELDSLGNSLVAVVKKTMQPERVSLGLRHLAEEDGSSRKALITSGGER